MNSKYKYPWKYTEEERPCGGYNRCYDCGIEYDTFPDMVLPNDLWELINPSQYKGSGILCPTCIASRLDFVDKWYELKLFKTIFGVNPDYIKLAQIAYDAVIETMVEGEKEHGSDGWKGMPIIEHKLHAYNHLFKAKHNFKGEDHIAHAMTRCAMIKYLEGDNNK